MPALLLAGVVFFAAQTVNVHASFVGPGGRGSFNGTYTVKGGRGGFLWTILFFDAGRVARADVRVGNGVLFPLCAPCTVGQSGATKLTRRGMRLLESGSASVVLVGTRGQARGRITTR